MEAAITGIGIATPKYKQSQQAASELVSKVLNLNPLEKRKLKALYRFTGIDYRYSVLSDVCKEFGELNFFPNDIEMPFPTTEKRMAIYKENALPLALDAIENCFSEIMFDKREITHLITVSCTGMYAPGLDIELVHHLQLKSSTKRTAINFMGCYGAFNGIRIAEAICKADPEASVLVVCVEIGTIHFQKKIDLDNLTSNAIFADGASCVLIQANQKVNKCFQLSNFYCDLLPQTSNEMAWHVGDFGFDIALTSYVPEAIASGIPAFLAQLSKNFQIKSENIDIYAIHPGAHKILKACEAALNISEDKIKYSYQVLKSYGNMSSATILFVLKLIWEEMTPETFNDKTIFSCAFGPGLTLESMLLTSYCQ